MSKLLPSHNELTDALKEIQVNDNGGFGFHMWATIVDRDGVVRVVTHSGEDRHAQWPGSRIISAQKAYTANAFSLPNFSLSTANLYYATQPGQSLYGLQHSNPVDAEAAYDGDPAYFGDEDRDGMISQIIGGINVFGGGLALYAECGALLGGLGVSGDSSVADHNIAWEVRRMLGLDYVPAGVNVRDDDQCDDNMVNDLVTSENCGCYYSKSGWGHPVTSDEALRITLALPKCRRVE